MHLTYGNPKICVKGILVTSSYINAKIITLPPRFGPPNGVQDGQVVGVAPKQNNPPSFPMGDHLNYGNRV
jgi:hypothetical protein